jgi:hypothetical protein
MSGKLVHRYIDTLFLTSIIQVCLISKFQCILTIFLHISLRFAIRHSKARTLIAILGYCQSLPKNIYDAAQLQR